MLADEKLGGVGSIRELVGFIRAQFLPEVEKAKSWEQ